MTTTKNTRFTRRKALQYGGTSMAALTAAPLLSRGARAQSSGPGKLLFVVAAGGGASILDSFLPVLDTEGNGGNVWSAAQIEQPNGSNLRCPTPLEGNSIEGAIDMGNGYAMSTFLGKHAQDTAVVTTEVTSVNHLVAAERAMTGNSINRGRTIQEAAALEFGNGMILPNVNMAGAGYFTNGRDIVPDAVRAEPVGDARLFPFSTHGFKGVKGAPSSSIMERARGLRSNLESEAGFTQTFKNNSLLRRYLERRDSVVGSMEADDLITKLMIFQNGDGISLTEYDLEQNPLGQTLIGAFPRMLTDPFESQAALAFLLTRFGVSCTVTISTSASPVFDFTGPEPLVLSAPIGFDWSHNDHRGGQNAMWSRILQTLDGLIDLLKAEPHMGDAQNGSMWDRSMVYVATEFGREKVSSGGSGHHLNNGNVLVSPLLKGNTVYGGVDPNTCLTYGFDGATGQPDTNKVMREEDVYSAVAQGLGIDFTGRHDMSGLVK